MTTISTPQRALLEVRARGRASATIFGFVDALVDGHYWGVLVELDENSGPSITNVSEEAVARARAYIREREPLHSALAPRSDSFFEAYEYRMRANQGIDPMVMRIAPGGGEWAPVSREATAQLDTPLCILMRCWDEAYHGSPEMEADIKAAALHPTPW